MKIGIYARKSVEQQDSVSIDVQIEECKRLVRPGDVVSVYSDNGFSGKNTERPDFKRLIADVEFDEIEKVIVYKLDRFSRNITDFYNVYEILKKHKCGFESVVDKFDTETAQGRFFMGILANFAQMERENISQRVKDSYYFRAKNDGRWLGGVPPFGFNPCKKDGKSSLEPNQYMDLVVEIYNKYTKDTTVSLHKLVAFAREQYDVKLSATQIRNILTNPLYVKADKKLYDYYSLKKVTFLNDKSEFNGKQALQILNKTDQSGKKTVFNDSSMWVCYLTNWEGVIPSRIFINVQERLGQNKAYTSSNKPTNKMLEVSGLVKCSKCGMAVKMKGKYNSLCCVGRSEYRGHCDASFRGVRLAHIQEQVAVEVQEHISDIRAILIQEEAEKKEMQSKIENLKKEIDLLIEFSLQDELLRDATLDKIRAKQTELSELELKFLNFHTVPDKIEERILRRTFRSNKDIIYDNLSTEEKQSLLRILIKRILLSEDGSISIQWQQ